MIFVNFYFLELGEKLVNFSSEFRPNYMIKCRVFCKIRISVHYGKQKIVFAPNFSKKFKITKINMDFSKTFMIVKKMSNFHFK